MRHAIAADTIFDGERVHRFGALLLEGEKILALTDVQQLGGAVPVLNLPSGAWLAPGFIDLQVNGGGDVLFNDAPTVETLRVIAAAHRGFGTTSFLPTLISDVPEKMPAALDAVGQARDIEPAVLGIHLEGPFLSPERAGVHRVQTLRTPTDEDLGLLTGERRGAMLVTLAPEVVTHGFIARLTGAGVKVSLGHTMASYEQARAALGEGATGFTHLFNAMRPLASRDPGPIAAALESEGAYYGLIVDGHHVHPAMLRLALRGAGQPFLVTDAMPPVGGSSEAFRLYGEEMLVRDGKCLRADGTLAGAALDMASAVRNCVRLLGAPLPRALAMASSVPAAFIGVDDRLGRLLPGQRADLVAIEPGELRVLDTWVAGKPLASAAGPL